MATQSPGIYFKEFDNTAYTNPKSTSGTTVCVVGYAKKGPIGEPTLITSWSDFVSAFGKPVDGYYSGLAVKNVLNAGGTVLFERVADATATQSNCVVKNPVEGFDGYITFDRADSIQIGAKGYQNGKIYGLKVIDSDGNSKDFYVRSPAEGLFSQDAILEQLVNQNKEEGTQGTCEATILNNIPEGLYSFKVSGKDIDENMKDVYVNLTAENTKNIFKEAVEKALSTGSNATYKLTLSKSNNGAGSSFSTTDEIGISGNKKFILTVNGNSVEYTINVNATDTYETLATKINSAVSASNVAVYIEDVEGFPTLVFVLLNKGAGNTVSVGSLTSANIKIDTDESTDEVTNTNNLFLSSKIDAEYNSLINNIAADSELAGFSIKVSEAKDQKNSDNALVGFKVEYIASTNSIVFVNDAYGPDSHIEVTEASSGDYLFDGNVTSEPFSIDGQDYINVNISRGYDKKIRFTSVKELEAPSLDNVDGYLSLLGIQKSASIKNSTGATNPVTGRVAIEASARDMIVFTSKEKGSATNNIAIEVYSSTSPVDGTVKHDLTIKVDGLLKETYEDISYNYADVDNRFDTIINESVENGGSSYVTVAIAKNDYTDPLVQLPDGVFYVGCPNSDGDVMKESDVDISAYTLYDYSLGSDGIPNDGGSELFEDVMKEGTSKLANKELYDFHVLITPDDISETVQTAAIKLCEDRGDAIAIIDPPIGLGVKEVINWHNGRGYGRASAPTSNYAATYWPWCKIYDNSSSGGAKFTWVMPSVVMAAKYVTVDKTAGCWYAPAGEQNGQLSVIDIEQYPNKLDRDELYVDYNRINPITKFKDGSIIAYGEKTLQRINSVLTKIHTRRMLVQIKKQCREALRGYIFQPNTAEYLSKISGNINAILETYKAGGGLNYYKVICDETNNPTEIRQQDIINVDVVLVPEGTIEQINISLTLNKSAETVTD